MTAGLHRDFVALAKENALTHDTATMLGTTVDLQKVTTVDGALILVVSGA